jgi:hypothetical protein
MRNRRGEDFEFAVERRELGDALGKLGFHFAL